MKKIFILSLLSLSLGNLFAQSTIEGINPTTSASVFAVKGTISSTSPGGFSAAVRGQNNGIGGFGIGVWGSQAGSGWGIYGSTVSGIGVNGFSTSGTAIFGTTSTGKAARFENVNAANTSNTIEVATNGTGIGIDVSLSNASNGARAVNVNQAGVGHGVYSTSVGGTGVEGITSSISAAGVIGRNATGEAIVGFTSGVSGVGAVVGRSDGAGYGIRGFNTQNGIGVFGQAGISGGTGKAARFENVNAANTSNVFEISSNSTSNLAVFIKSGINIARIDATGKGFFNGGTQASGADLAEAFDVEGTTQNYEAGDIMIISTKNDRTLAKSDEAYSNLVVGVYATKPGVLLTEENIDNSLTDKIPLGVVGVIPTKVCLEGGKIKRGDFLVTSSQKGVAMKADLSKIKTGQLIGKALQDYNEEIIGKIKVLVNVQ